MVRPILLSALFFSACGGSREAEPTPPSTPQEVIEARPGDPEPCAFTRPLDEQEARSEATRLAEQAFAADTSIVDAAGNRVQPARFPPGDFQGGLEGERWQFRNEPIDGSFAVVSFGRFGDHPEVRVGFATD